MPVEWAWLLDATAVYRSGKSERTDDPGFLNGNLFPNEAEAAFFAQRHGKFRELPGVI